MKITIEYAPVPFIESTEFIDILTEQTINGKRTAFKVRYSSSEPISKILDYFKPLSEKKFEALHLNEHSLTRRKA